MVCEQARIVLDTAWYRHSRRENWHLKVPWASQNIVAHFASGIQELKEQILDGIVALREHCSLGKTGVRLQENPY